MMSDGEILAAVTDSRISIDPFHESDVQPASVDLHLGVNFRTYDSHRNTVIDPLEKQTDLTRTIQVDRGDAFILHPGEFVLGHTLERVLLPADIIARLEGKSSLARLGLLVHVTGGFIDPGFEGDITLEMSNVNTLPIKLRPLMKIAQISFAQMSQAALRPYGHPTLGSKYQGQSGATESRFHLNDERHFVTFNERGWFIEHPMMCRVEEKLSTCEYNHAIQEICDTMEEEDQWGRYLILRLDSEGLPELERV